MTIEIISQSISSKVWDRDGITLASPGSAVRHVTYCTYGPGACYLLQILGGILSEKLYASLYFVHLKI